MEGTSLREGRGGQDHLRSEGDGRRICRTDTPFEDTTCRGRGAAGGSFRLPEARHGRCGAARTGRWNRLYNYNPTDPTPGEPDVLGPGSRDRPTEGRGGGYGFGPCTTTSRV